MREQDFCVKKEGGRKKDYQNYILDFINSSISGYVFTFQDS